MKSEKNLVEVQLVQTEDKIPIVQKSWGFERIVCNNELYCGKELVCIYGKWSSEGKFHYHKKKDEVFYVVSGALELETIQFKTGFNKVFEYFLKRGDSFRIKPFVAHRFRSKSKMFCKFIEFSTTHFDEDTFYLEE